MKVLVTGHHGYIGSVMAPFLHDAGLRSPGSTRSSMMAATSEPIGSTSLRPGVRDLAADALTGFDAVVHLAALSNDPLGDLNARWTYDVNLNGTGSLSRAAKEAGVRRFLFASSCSMYGVADLSELVTEEAPLMPLTPCRGRRPCGSCPPQGARRHDPQSGVQPGADSENDRVSELAEITRDTLPGSTIDHAGGSGPDPRRYRVDVGKLSRAFPGYRPHWRARDGARELFDAYRKANLNLDTFQGDRFVRIARLKLLIEKRDLGKDLRWRQAAAAMR